MTNKVEAANCPKCGAVCVNGHDDDGQIFCAACGCSFPGRNIMEVDISQARIDLFHVNNDGHVYTKCTASGWTAYKKIV